MLSHNIPVLVYQTGSSNLPGRTRLKPTESGPGGFGDLDPDWPARDELEL